MRRFGGTHRHLRLRRSAWPHQAEDEDNGNQNKRDAEPKDHAQTGVVSPLNDPGQIVHFRRRPKRKRMDGSGTGNDFFDRLTFKRDGLWNASYG
jgi:hypothetical protein